MAIPASDIKFGFGDRVVHRGKPEWGEAVVTAVKPSSLDGTPCQSVTMRFTRAGVKTLSTAVADLAMAGDVRESAGGAAAGDDTPGEVKELDAAGAEAALLELPAATRDPFNTLESRMRATLGLYRFTDQGGSLLDWAATQTGLADPLSVLNRHQLEDLFKRFSVERDRHLYRLGQDARKSDPKLFEKIQRDAPGQARDALRRPHTRR